MLPILVLIGSERGSIRRVPAVTLSIIALCTGVFLLTELLSGTAERRLDEAIDRAVRYWVERPYLVPPDDMKGYLEDLTEEEEQALRRARAAGSSLDPDSSELERQQGELESLWAEVIEVQYEDPLMRWGLSSSEVTAVTLVTHLFLHGDWLHLLGNMLFLFVVGTLLEDVWGRVAFGGFYLLAGFVSALVDPVLLPYDNVVSFGASGAISGVMGAFLVRFWNVRLRILASVLVLSKTFWMRAWLILGFWFVQDLFSIREQLAGGSVAYLGHVAGFAFGALFALVFLRVRAEERWLEPVLKAKTEREVLRDDHLDRAVALARAGSREKAFALLGVQAERAPANVDAALALWSLALELGRAGEAAQAMGRAIGEELRRGQRDLALEHWRDLSSHAPGATLDPQSQVALAATLVERHRWDEAADLLRSLLESKESPASPATLVRAASLAERFHLTLAGALASRALARSDLDPGERGEAERLLARAARASVPVTSPGTPASR